MTAWRNHFDRLRSSEGKVLWKHLYLGKHAVTGEPIYVPTQRSNRHVWLQGPSGAGKSALFLILYVLQRLAQGASVIVVGAKPDKLLFHSTRKAAEEFRLPFRWLDITPGRSSFVMNGLRPWHAKFKSTQGQAETLMQAAGLDSARNGDGQFFAKMDEFLLMTSLAKFPEDRRFADMARRFDDFHAFKPPIDEKMWRYSTLARSEVTRLGNVTALNPGPETPELALAHAIEMAHPFLRQEVIFAALDARALRGTTKAVTGLMFYGLADAATVLRDRPHKVVLVLDDSADIIAGDNLAVILETVRDLGIELVVAHQDSTQLFRGGQNIRGALEGNTGLHVVLNPQEAEVREWIIRTSGERTYPTVSWSQDLHDPRGIGSAPPGGWLGWPVQVSQRVGPTIDLNTVIRLSAEPGMAFVRLPRDEGLARYRGAWLPVRLDYHIPPEEAEDRADTPWPEASPYTVTNALGTEFDRRFQPPPPTPKKGGFGKLKGS